MKKVPPPAKYAAYSPSELFRFFFQIGHWTEESFISDFQSYTRGKLISTVTVNKWKNRDVIPTRYSGQLFKLIKDQFEDKVSDNWILAFETVWATHQARSHEAAPKLTQDKLSSQICAQHINWIQAEYNRAHQGETFSTAEIYVPIQLIDQLIDKTLEAPTLYEVEDLVTAFSENPNALTAHDWIFISGGSGSGKSMASLHLGHKISNTDVFPIYLRGRHWSDIEMDFRDSHHPISDAFSYTSYLKYFRSSSHQRACLIIDGIDEISAVGSKDSRSLNSIFAALISEQNICRSHGKALHIVMTGRRAHVEFGTKLISPEQLQHLELLGLDGSYRHQGDLSSETLGHDLRQLWWEKYLAANAEKPDPSLPDFLSVEYSDFSDLSSSPLLTYLLCWIALNSEDTCNTNNTFAYERVNNLTQSNHTNDVYLKLIESIWSRGELQKRYNIDADSFLSVLQHIALATWHAPESQSISLEAVHDYVEDEKTKFTFKSLNLLPTPQPTHPPETLITHIYSNVADGTSPTYKTAIEFSHQSISEYLTSTVLLNSFHDLLVAYETDAGLDKALKHWAKISRAGQHSPSLADFCQQEASLQYDRFSNLNLDSAFVILRKHLGAKYFDTKGSDIISQLQTSASLLLFIWSCLNLERYTRTANCFDLFKDSELFNSLDLKQIQLSNGLDIGEVNLTEPQIQNMSFLTQSLSAVELNAADLSQLNFTIGHMQAFKCDASSFALTHWSHVKISESIFQKSIFQQTIIHGCRWLNTAFSASLFQNVKFQLTYFFDCELIDSVFTQCHFTDVEFRSTHMQGVIFDRCTFVRCSFKTPQHINLDENITFRHSTFLEMSEVLEEGAAHHFEQCIFPEPSINKADMKSERFLNTQVGGLLS